MNLIEGFELLKSHGIPVVDYVVCNEPDDVNIPSVLKVVFDSPEHKSELDAVKIVHTYSEVHSFFRKFPNNTIISQPIVSGVELIVGKKVDPQFGQVVLLGIGGVIAELLNDVSVRACPISQSDVLSMVGDLKLSKVIMGYRNMGVELPSLVDVIMKLCNLPVKEIDINPLFGTSGGVVAADVRIIN